MADQRPVGIFDKVLSTLPEWFSIFPKLVKLTIRNELRQPFFEETIELRTTQKTLFPMMQQAADINEKFRFTAKYFGSELGFYIEGINDVFGNYALDKSYWAILDGGLNPTPVGVSSYEPSWGETVTFNLTRGSDCGE